MTSPKGRILCTEDDADTRDLIVLILEGEGYEVHCTDSPEQALDFAKTRSFDLVFVDTWLSGMAGTELTAKIREFDTQTPILFYSGAGLPADKENARRAGAQGYLVKGVSREQLVNEVERLITQAKYATGKQ